MATIGGSEIRCWRCGQKLANSAKEYDITCRRCHASNRGG